MEASKGVQLTPKIYRAISKRAKEIIGLLTLAIFLSLIENRIPSSSVSIFLIVDTIRLLQYILLCTNSVLYDILHMFIYYVACVYVYCCV